MKVERGRDRENALVRLLWVNGSSDIVVVSGWPEAGVGVEVVADLAVAHEDVGDDGGRLEEVGGDDEPVDLAGAVRLEVEEELADGVHEEVEAAAVDQDAVEVQLGAADLVVEEEEVDEGVLAALEDAAVQEGLERVGGLV